MPAHSFMSNHATLANLHRNSRFYILTGSILVSFALAAWLRMTIQSDRLYYIRAEQIFGFLSLLLWYFALIVTPLQKVFGKKPWIDLLQFSRRGFGVSAAYFAVLHIGISIWGQLGGIGQLVLLPDRFKVSFLLGAIAAAVLLIMAATSFDKVIKFLTMPRWKQIHRLGYTAGILALVHVWMVGTHVGRLNVSIVAFCLLAILFGLESYRISLAAASKWRLPRKNQIAVFLICWYFLSYSLALVPQILPNYHGERHSSEDNGGQHETH